MTELSSSVPETLREGGEFILYRGRLHGYPCPVLVVALAAEQPSPQSVKRLEHEYSLSAELEPAWAARPLALTRQGGRRMLVLQDPGGAPLDRVLERGQGQALALTRVLRIAIGMATALGQVHRHGLIHKDIHPANVLVDDADNVWLTGFGIASRLPRESQAPTPPEIIAGTLAYMAPEQTGRMNRSIDARSDLYSLGVTLYEMLTGALPFSAVDPLEWVHCHIARQPVPPRDRAGVPQALSLLTLKLLAKTAEERYQTAAGVEADLRRCLAQWESQGRIEAFALGAQDVSDRLLIPEKLYGREREIEALLAAFDRVVANGTPELVLVSGYSGIGKSSVVNELHKVLVVPRGLFASGKFDQYKRDIPYATLAQAFQSLVRPLLGRSEAELGRWRDALRAALGANGQLMVNLVPELELVLGPQPPVADLAPQDAKNRFQMLFRRFVAVFARPEHPLALFLDDLQWLDAATLDLLEHLITHSEVRHLLLVGAYRDNEVSPSHPFMSKLDAIRKAGACVQEIRLAPLAREDLKRLIADTLSCARGRAAPLAQLVHEKTDGNPFFAIQFIHAIAEEGLLRFDHDAARWRWELDRVHAKGYTDNVVDLMVGRLTRLPVETQAALQQLACLGNVAGITMLSLVLGKSNEDVGSDLRDAVRLELVGHLEGSYKFTHDRVQEAAYSLMPERLRAEAHLRIGRLLAAHTPAEKREEAVFEIVNQLNRGAALITSPDEREQLAELNLIAGRRAKASTAYAAALSHLIAGAALLAEDCWERRHELSIALELGRAECEFLTGALAQAGQRLAALSTRTADAVERATVACLRIDLYTTLDQGSRAVAVGLDYLRQLGMDWTPHPTQEEARREYERIWSQLGSRTIESLITLPFMSDPTSLATLDVLTKMGPPAFFTDANLLALVSCRAVNLSLERGNCEGSCVAYAYLGMIAGPRFGDYQQAFRFGQLGYDLVEERRWTRFQARTYIFFGNLVLPWTKHVRAGRDLVRRAFEAANKIGDLTFAIYCGNELTTNMLAAGDPLVEVQRAAEQGLAFARKARFGFVMDAISTQLGLIRTLRGLTPTFGAFDDAEFDERRIEHRFSENADLVLVECWYWVRKLQARFFAGDYGSAIEASSRAQPLLWTSPSFFETAEYHFYGAVSQAAYCDSAPAGERQQHLDAVAAHHHQLEIWAANCPENFENRAALVGAEIARIEGRDVDAMRLYEKAIRSARASDFVHNEALANELAGRFYLARGLGKNGHAHLRDARSCYALWGADGKTKQLERLYPFLAAAERHRPAATSGSQVQQLDLASVVKASHAISGKIVLEDLVDTLMRLVLENAGAQAGHLILARDDRLVVVAEASVEQREIQVRLHPEPAPPESALPASIVNYVRRSRERVLLADAAQANPYSTDDYFARRQPKSVLCLPIIRRSALIGLLYLENDLAAHAFTSERLTVLELLASQAAISLENALLYADLRQENGERKQAEEALREREARIRRLVESNIIGVFFWDLAGGITEANDAFLQSVGYSRQDLLSGKVSWASMTPPEYHAADTRAIEELAQSGTCQPFEKEFIRNDGGRVAVLIAGATFEGANEQGVSFVLDLTERKAAEVERARLGERLRQGEKMEALGRLAGGIAHDFNNILGGILGYAEMLVEGAQPGSAPGRYAQNVLAAANRARGLVDQILAYSRGQRGQRAPVDLCRVVGETLELVRGSLAAGVRLEPKLPKGPLFVVGDATQLHQVLMNLCTNAIQAMGVDGTLRIALEAAEADGTRALTHGTLHPGPYVRLAVEDSGPGMNEATVARIFEPLFTTKEVGKGTGLGLSLVYGIVNDAGGGIDVTSAVGRGSTFTIYLPRVDTVLEAADENQSPVPRGNGERVLVVDDEESLVAVTCEVLLRLGYEPIGFSDSRAALAAFESAPERFDAAITDEVMPGLTGTELAALLHRRRAGLPIVLVSGYIGPLLAERAHGAGVTEILKKPVQSREIAQALAHVMHCAA